MTLTIYVDVLFLLNMIIDYIIIASTAFMSGKECNAKRTVIASAVGALYSTLIFFPELNALNISVCKVLISFIIVLIAFKYINTHSYIKTVIIFYIINFIYGGGMYVFHRYTNLGSKMSFSNGEFYIDMPLWLIVLLSVAFYFMIKILCNSINNRFLKEKTVNISIEIKEKATEVTALLDTGNALYDPVSRLPVMLVQRDSIDNIIDCNNLFCKNKDEKFFSTFSRHGFRIIPYKDAAGNKNTIYAFKPTKISICKTGEVLNDMLIGIVEHSLSADKSYSALLHSKTYIRR